MPSENQSFLNEGVTSLSYISLVYGGQVTRLYDGTILGGCDILKGVLQAVEKIAVLAQ